MIYSHLWSQYLSTEGLCNVIAAYIESDGDRYSGYVDERGKRRRVSRIQYNANRVEDLWRTSWGIMLQDESLLNNTSRASMRFRRRFRVSYSVFIYICQRCKDLNIFGATKIPYEIRILIGLRILARGNCADDISEMSGIAESTVNTICHQFTEAFVTHFYDEFVSFPAGERLKTVVKAYEDLGFPGACGSMDVTHVRLHKCPHGLRVLATGKEGYPTLGFQAICAPNREILYCSRPYLGSYNDITITNDDVLCQAIQDGLLDGVEYKLTGEDGIPRRVSGGYVIVDGGYQQTSWLINPFGSACTIEEKRWSEWLESVRKDIECTFGILKARFRLFDQPLRFHKFEQIENAWKTCCILHNMLITYNCNDLEDWEKNINWSYIDPYFDTVDGAEVEDENVNTMNDYFAARSPLEVRARNRRNRDPPIVFDTTDLGSVFCGNNDFDYYNKRQQLVRHWNFRWRLGLVKWPRRSGVAVRLCMRIPRIDMRRSDVTRYALYSRHSDLLLKYVQAHESPTIGRGLFSHLGYSKGDVIAEFQGVIMTREEYDDDAAANGSGGYCVALNHGRVLQCFTSCMNGECLASLANCARGCINVTTNQNAVFNCKTTVNNNDVVKLVCNREYISPHTELAHDYGEDFLYPHPLPL